MCNKTCIFYVARRLESLITFSHISRAARRLEHRKLYDSHPDNISVYVAFNFNTSINSCGTGGRVHLTHGGGSSWGRCTVNQLFLYFIFIFMFHNTCRANFSALLSECLTTRYIVDYVYHY